MPAVVTLKGIGNAGKHNPYNLGMLGMHGSRAANKAVDECDLLLVIGARLDDRATGKLDGFAPNAKMIHIDADAAEINKLRPADLAIRGDLNSKCTDKGIEGQTTGHRRLAETMPYLAHHGRLPRRRQ